MNKTQFTVDETLSGLRLDKALTMKLDALSRMQIKTLLNDDEVLVDGEVKKPSYHIKLGETIDVNLPEPTEISLDYQAMDLKIHYEDEYLLVVEKPSGLITHPASTTQENTLLHGLLNKIDASNFEIPHRAGVVHRLDKETSGLLVFAKDQETLETLQKSMQKREIKRLYLAIVEGVIDHNRGKINAPIGRHPKKRHLMSVLAEGKDSVTNFQVLERFEAHTYIECDLESGRTHQIRVHMQYIDHPIMGDYTYGKKKQKDDFGQYLHAYKLSFTHPKTNESLTFEADLPKVFEDKLSQLRQG